MRGLVAAIGHGFKYRDPQFSVDHLIVGGGVVGLAIAQRLANKFPEKSTYLIERHDIAGQETSSRNSEVIHGGLYYPAGSLKSRLCIRGRQLMYAHCDALGVPYKKLGKLVVALPHQTGYLEKLHAHCQTFRSSTNENSVPTELISGDKARELEPDLHRSIASALWSSETGIVDSHALMDSLESDIAASEGGELVYGTRVVRVDPSQATQGPKKDGWIVQMVTSGSTEPDVVFAKTLINASGLASHQILNSLLPRLEPPQPPIPIYHARGSYAAYRGRGVGNVKRLIYPVPEQGNKSAFHGLGTHLTLDMDGNIRFGPDVEWIEPPSSSSGEHSANPDDIDYWEKHLAPSPMRIPEMHQSISTYLDNISLEGLSPDYVGVRPKLVGPSGGFQDFVIRSDWSGKWNKTSRDDEGAQMVTLMGIESPGLTSSLAIAEMVVQDVMKPE